MSTTTSRRIVVAAALAAFAVPTAVVGSSGAATTTATASTASAAPFCGITWGSGSKSYSPLWTGRVLGVRAGQHTCYDRLVFDIARGSGKLGYHVAYVTNVIGPSGIPTPVSGGAKLQITINAPATVKIPSSGTMSFSGWRTFRQLKWVASFEGYTDFGLGVRAKLPMRVLTLTNTDGSKRLVVDVAHAW